MKWKFGVSGIAVLFALVSVAAYAQQQIKGQSQFRTTILAPQVIATGNTYQLVLTAQTDTNKRQALTIENNNGTDYCFVFIGSNITPGTSTYSSSVTINGTTTTYGGASIELLPGGSYSRYWPYVPPDQISATCTGTNDTLYVDYQ